MCESSFLTFKDLFYLILGIIVGLIFGVGIYWWPLGQFVNEWKALWNLARHRYKRGDTVTIKIGTDLIRAGVTTYPNLLAQDAEMTIWHDEGVDWFFTSSSCLPAGNCRSSST
jgi:hypothetical protein